jgi:acetate kinase
MDVILVVNAGSSSVKFRVFEIESALSLRQLISGQMIAWISAASAAGIHRPIGQTRPMHFDSNSRHVQFVGHLLVHLHGHPAQNLGSDVRLGCRG